MTFMAMIETHIQEIRHGLRGGRFQNEASVSQGIVLRILGALEWPTYDTQIVCPEYSIEGLRVDFALCHPPDKPLVFIEVKQIGQIDGAERQLFEYAFHRGVPFVILTDGRVWNFFLPAEAGDYRERRVYQIDLIEREVQESVRRYLRYLKYDAVCTGEALLAARRDYQDVSRDRQIHQTFPKAWRRLVEEEDEILLDLMAESVESICGYKPDPDAVAEYMKKSLLDQQISNVTSVQKGFRPVQPEPRKIRGSAHGQNVIGYRIDGRYVQCRNARDVLVSVLEAFSERDATFPQKFASLPQHGRKRRYIAVTREELYPGRPDLALNHSHQLRSGYWVGTNVSRMQIEIIIKAACGVVDLRYGEELVINLGSRDVE